MLSDAPSSCTRCASRACSASLPLAAAAATCSIDCDQPLAALVEIVAQELAFARAHRVECVERGGQRLFDLPWSAPASSSGDPIGCSDTVIACGKRSRSPGVSVPST